MPNDLYRKSIEKLQRGIANNFSQRKCPSWEWAHRLTDETKVNLDITKDRLDFLKSKVKAENVGDDSPRHASMARPQANQNRRAWQKAAPSHDGALIFGGPTWLKMAKICAPGRQENDRSLPLPPRTSVTPKNQAAIASWLGVVLQAVAPQSQTLPGNTTV